MSQTTRFDDAYFDRMLGEKKEETVRSYGPLRVIYPKPTDFAIMLEGARGGIRFNPSGVIEYLRANLIIYDNAVIRRFDGRVYSEIPLQMVKDLIYDAVAQSGSTYIPTDHDMRTILHAARSLLRAVGLSFPEPQMGEPYETFGEGQLIAFENGIYNTVSGELLPFTPYIFLTSYLHARYDPTVTDCDARRVLSGIIPAQETLDFLFEMCGFFFFDTEMYPPALFNLYGPGNTGKSAIDRMITVILGWENVSQMGIQQLTSRFTTAELEGKRLNICGETGDTSSKVTRIDGELLKRLTDGQKLLVERKGQDPYYMVNTAKFLFVTNTIPDFGDNSSGLYRRLYVIPCRIQQDKTAGIYDKLTDEKSRSWIVQQAFEGYRNFLARGKTFCVSAQMESELDQFKSQDSVMDFILATFGTLDTQTVARRIVEDETLSWTTELYDVYTEYTRNALSQPLSRKKFVERIRNEYALKKKTVAVQIGEKSTTREKYVI